MTSWDRAFLSAETGWTAAMEAGALTPSTRSRYLQIWASLCRYAAAADLVLVESPVAIRRFIWAPLRGARPVSGSTARLRLTVMRSAFTFIIAEGLWDQDPTAGIQIAHVPRRFVPHPLTPPEVSRLLASGRMVPSDTLRPATVALALAGATHSEIAAVVANDLDLQTMQISLGQAGTRRAVEIELPLILAARVNDVRRSSRRRGNTWSDAHMPIALSRPTAEYGHNSLAATVGGNLARALRHAGVIRHQIRPKSIREYAANTYYAQTRSIEKLAAHLGSNSLDSTSRLIDREWQERWGAVIRQAGKNEG